MSAQSHYREVPRWEIFMEQKLRFGLNLDRMANFPAFIKLQDLLTYEPFMYLKWNDTICGFKLLDLILMELKSHMTF